MIPSFLLPQKLASELVVGGVCAIALFGGGMYLQHRLDSTAELKQIASRQADQIKQYQRDAADNAKKEQQYQQIASDYEQKAKTQQQKTNKLQQQIIQLSKQPAYQAECLSKSDVDLVNQALRGGK